MAFAERSRFHRGPGWIAACCLLVLCVPEAQSGVIMKKDGTSISGAFEAAQSIKLLTSSGEISVRLSDVKWMAGSDLRKLRVAGMKTLLSGTLLDPELTIQRIDKDKKKPTSIPAAEIVFLFGGDVDLSKTSELRIEEYGGDMRVLSYSKSKRSAKLAVTLIPENWRGDIQIMKPSYRERMSNREEFSIGFVLRADAGTKAGLEKMATDPSADRPRLTFEYIFEGGKGQASGPIEIKLEKDNAASAESYQQTLTKSFGTPFYMEIPGRRPSGAIGDVGRPQQIQEVSGSGYFNLHIDSGTERLANGQLEIVKTMSNVLRLPIALEKR